MNAFGNALGESLASSMQPEAGYSGGLKVKGSTAQSWGPQYSFDDSMPEMDFSLTAGGVPRLGSGDIGYTGGQDFANYVNAHRVVRGEVMSRETRLDGRLIEAKQWPIAGSTSEPVAVDPETGFASHAIRESRIESQVLPSAQPIVMRPFDAIASLRQQDLVSYRAMQDRADNPFDYVGAKFGSLASEVFYDSAEAVRGVYRLATDAGARSRAADQLWYVATHPMAPVVAGVESLMNTPWVEMPDKAFKLGLGGFAGAGFGKASLTVGGLAGDAAVATGRWLAPSLDKALFNGMDRMGLVLRVAPDAPSLLPSGLLGDARALSVNMGGALPEGYASHHLVMSSMARNSTALRYLAENDLYDVNRATNGLRLPTNDFLALADELPLHRGFHGYEYRMRVQGQLDLLDASFDSGLSNAQLLQRVTRIEQGLAKDLTSGKLWLNDADAALRKLGPFKP